MLARIQQFLVTGFVLALVACVAFLWQRGPAATVLGLMAVVGVIPAVLALEFLLAERVNRTDPVPRASGLTWLRAWWSEAGTTPRIFGWRQPFRSGSVPDFLPDNDLRGVVFVHGFFCNRGFWNPWMTLLRGEDRAFVAVNLEPVFGSIDAYAAIIDEAVARVTQATGLPPVLVCHSMGGLAARAWLRSGNHGPRVSRVVTIGTPHHGTWLARFSHVRNGRQMQRHSAWTRELAAGQRAEDAKLFTCWYSNCDNIVFPASTAILDGADNRLVNGVPHVALGFYPEVVQRTLELVRR